MKVAEVVYHISDCMNHSEYCSIAPEFIDTLTLSCQVLIHTKEGEKVGIVKEITRMEESDSTLVASTIVRVLSEKDLKQIKINEKDSVSALSFAKGQAKRLGLLMSFVDAFYTFDRKQLYLTYTADNRVDFRELAKTLAQKYKTRIELRQIGVRDKARKVGGLGPCGLFLCCNTFLSDFVSVSINMAKNQSLALNPSKINGLCGRLLCCLNYEDEMYTELKKGIPAVGSYVETKSGLGRVIDVDVLRGMYKIETKNKGIIEVEV